MTDPVQFAGNVTAELKEKVNQGVIDYALKLILKEASPAYAWVPVSVPADATGIFIDFLFDGVGDDDYLTIGIDDELLFLISGRDILDGDLVNTGLLDISQWAGQEVELFVGLNSDGVAGGRMVIEEIGFAIPEPSSAIILGISTVLLRRRFAA